ncbi:MAG: helix-turn-helix domain-containing protein, partial [Cyanobacteria bacterium J06632_3]
MAKFSAPQQSQLAQIGAFLRENREKQQKSLEDIAIRTYIRPQLLNGIEMGNPDVLPEPIFVQGFIRRYAETLGLKGVELSQQFTVTSIPSTPRPAKATTLPDSNSTRLLTRDFSTTTSPLTAQQSKTATDDAPPIFNAGSTAPLEEANNVVKTTVPEPTTHAFSENLEDIPIAPENAVLENTPVQPLTQLQTTDESLDSESETDETGVIGDDTIEMPSVETVENSSDGEISADISSLESIAETTNTELTEDIDSDDFLSKVSAFDQNNLETNNDLPNVTTPQADLQSTVAKPEFDDGLPAIFTTQEPEQTASAQPPVKATTPKPSPYPPQPVGVELGQPSSPNLKPFAIGAVAVSALVAGVILLANLFGGQNRAPVVEAPETVEQTTEQLEEGTESATPELPPTPAETEPAISEAPIYVEAAATSEAWVSI